MSENGEQVRTAWQEAFHSPPPSRQTIYWIRNKFDSTGSVSKAPKSGRSKTSVTERNEMLVAMAFVNCPKKSTQRASLELSIPRTPLQRLMHKLKLRHFRARLVHGVLEGDPDRRLQSCELMRDQIANE
ncbi:Hypothetical predicted protein [Octopus vulgaris]|uniref:DUF4817 domain-containing protein n=1 Tax=Octopus vulgaris TaxID=6645 RepID=A0AA36BK54_OCTVU|nr:Hypothetical predicted protein [Octopus vulgaris]